jgi:hypothetical protein
MHVSDEVNTNIAASSSDALTSIPIDQLRIRSKCRHPSGKFEEFRKEELEQSIHERFEKQVKKHGNRLARRSGSGNSISSKNSQNRSRYC